MKKLHEFCPSDRYVYDCGMCSSKNGFAQVDTSQDASYYGTWANPFKFVIFNYCEGDCYTTKCDNEKEFIEEMKSLKAWNNKNGHSFGIDPGFNEQLKKAFEKIGLSDMLH